jgi:hypothetical protein
MSHQIQEESKTESRIPQYENNEGLLTQNRSLTTLEKAEIKGKQVTDAGTSADSEPHAAMQLSFQSNSTGLQQGHSGMTTIVAAPGDMTNETQGAGLDQVVSPHIKIPFTSVNDQCDWLDNGGSSSPITNDSSFSYSSDTDTVYDLFHNIQIAGLEPELNASSSVVMPTPSQPTSGPSSTTIGEAESISTSKKTSRHFETTPQKNKEFKPSDTPTASPEGHCMSEEHRSTSLGMIAMVQDEKDVQSPLHQTFPGKLFPASPEKSPVANNDDLDGRPLSSWSRSPSPAKNASFLTCIQRMMDVELDWCDPNLRTEESGDILLDIVQTSFPRQRGQPFESYVAKIHDILQLIDDRVFQVYGKFIIVRMRKIGRAHV